MAPEPYLERFPLNSVVQQLGCVVQLVQGRRPMAHALTDKPDRVEDLASLGHRSGQQKSCATGRLRSMDPNREVAKQKKAKHTHTHTHWFTSALLDMC